MKDNLAGESEQTWDTIAESFDTTRRKPWQQCIDFINELPKSAVVADLGCGNGRHLIPCAERCKKVIGLDISRNLLKITLDEIGKKELGNVNLIHGNLVDLPFKNNSLDAILYIASLHNIKGRENRICSLKEVKRVLKEDGRALISVWSRWQDKFRIYFLKQLFNHKGEFGDIEIYWKQHKLNVPRFYHLYSKSEFVDDIEHTGLNIKNIFSVKLYSKQSSDNYFTIVTKGNY
jgi:alkylated DNA repair protein alkB family protein 8